MSNENEAVQAGAKAYHAYMTKALEAQGGSLIAWDDMTPDVQATWLKDARTYYGAMREIIAREVIAGVCRREGHDETEITTYADLGNIRRFVCARCSARREEPYDKWASARTNLSPPSELTDKVPSWMISTPDPPADATHVVLHDRRGNTLAVGDLVKAQCPGCKRTIGSGRCSSAECPMARVEIPVGKPLEAGDDQRRAIPAPEPCPFDCDTGPLGRDQLLAHIAQQHPDARSVQSVLGGDDPRERAR